MPDNILYVFMCKYLCLIFAFIFPSNLSTRSRAEHKTKQNKLHGLSPRANYTDLATAACRRSDCQLLRIKGATWSA
jgi:hypothetical protein